MGLAENPRLESESYVSNVGGLLTFVGAPGHRLAHDSALLLGLYGGGDDRVVLTAHSTCGGYLDALGADEESVRLRQVDDMRVTAEQLREALPGVKVDCYYLDTQGRTVALVSD